MSPSVFALAMWLAATLGHVVLSVRAVRRLASAEDSVDYVIFASVLAIVGTLSAIVHTAATTTGLNLNNGFVLLVVWHLSLWLVTRRFAPPSLAPLRVLERIALVVWLGIVVSWVDVASQSSALFGPDAMHYHVPHALNFAAGANLFDLPATPHPYPMAGSVIAAWFILPLGDPLLVDLAMLLPFALVVASLNLIFRLTTRQSGLAWCSWLCLLLFSTPMFRGSSAGAADLWFAAGFVSVLGVMMTAWTRGAWTTTDLALFGMATGILVGSKVSGAPAMALLVLGFVLISLVRRLSFSAARRVQLPQVWPVGVLAGLVLMIGSGGIWLVRNWIQHGSPILSGFSIAGVTLFPGGSFERTTYLSVLGELQSDRFNLVERVTFFIGRWFGAWFMPSLVLIPMFTADVLLGVVRKRTDARIWLRLGLLLQVLFSGSVLVWLLIGAPWTALDRSDGLTLRYVLPLAALLPLLSFLALFPISYDWSRRPVQRLVATTVVVSALVMFWRSLGTAPVSDSGLPPLELRWLLLSAVIVGIHAMTRVRSIGRGWRTSARLGGWIAGSILLAAVIHSRDLSVRAGAQSALALEEDAYAAGIKPASGWREIFLGVRSAERAAGQACPTRRFLSLVRDDEPMALQPPETSSRVYYAGRDLESTMRAGPVVPCDYIVTTDAIEATDKGQALVQALAGGRSVARLLRVGQFVVYGAFGR